MRVSNLLYFSYWFSQPDPAGGGLKIFWPALFGVFTVLGIVALVAERRGSNTAERQVFKRSGSAATTLGVLGFIWFFFRQESVLLLGFRLWWGLWVVGAVVWFISIGRYALKRVPAIKAENEARGRREQYLPRG